MTKTLPAEPETSRWSDLWTPEHLAPTATVALGVVLFAFNAFVVATALPQAVVDFGGKAWLAWATSLYIIASMLSGPAAAAVMHRLGARRMFLWAGLVFMAGTFLAALAPGMGWLLAGRALQGFGAGFIESGCYVLIPQLFPSRLIPRVFGVEAVAWAVAAFGAPALAGWLAEVASWRWALLSAVPMALVFLVLVPKVVSAQKGQPGAGPGLPLIPLLGCALGMALVLVSDGAGGLAPVWLVAGAAAFGLALRWDARAGVRLFPRGAFGFGALGLGLWLALLMPLSQSVESVFLPYGLQVLWGFSPLQAGLSATLLALSWSGAQTLIAGYPGPRARLVLAGVLLLVLGQGGMILAFVIGSVGLMLGAQVLLGAAFGVSWGALSQMVMEAAGEERDVASGLLPVVMSAGYGIGAAIYGLAANASGFATGADLRVVLLTVFGLGGAVALVALIPAIRVASSGNSR